MGKEKSLLDLWAKIMSKNLCPLEATTEVQRADMIEYNLNLRKKIYLILRVTIQTAELQTHQNLIMIKISHWN